MFCSSAIPRVAGVVAPAILLLSALVATNKATAQSQPQYRCTSASGGTYWSDRPCSGKMGQLGGGGDTTQAYRAPTPRVQRMPEAPAHQNYLTAACAELSEAIRTGPSRGLGYDTISALRREWQERCQEDEQDARKQLSQARREERDRKVAEKAAVQRAATERQDEADRCALMRKNLATRRERPNPTAGEQADLQRFEATYRERCPG